MRTLLIALTFAHAMAVPCLAETFQERIGLCLTWHGENGQSDNVEVPSLGAEPAPFVLIQLYLFREKQRRVEPMTDAAKDLTDDDLRQFSDGAEATSRQSRCGANGTRPGARPKLPLWLLS